MSNNTKYIKYKNHNKELQIDGLTPDKSKQIVNDFMNSIEIGNEELHMYEDAIYKTFIKNLAEDKIKDIDEARKIAKNLTKISNFEYPRWYA